MKEGFAIYVVFLSVFAIFNHKSRIVPDTIGTKPFAHKVSGFMLRLGVFFGDWVSSPGVQGFFKKWAE